MGDFFAEPEGGYAQLVTSVFGLVGSRKPALIRILFFAVVTFALPNIALAQVKVIISGGFSAA
jgi:hypothetical protein